MEESNEDKGIINSLLFWRDEDEADSRKDKKSSSVSDEPDDGKINRTDDFSVEESNKDEKLFSEKSWDEKLTTLKFWGSDEEQKPDDEFRYRIRISPMDDVSKVFLDLPNGSLNNSEESQQIIKIIFEQLK